MRIACRNPKTLFLQKIIRQIANPENPLTHIQRFISVQGGPRHAFAILQSWGKYLFNRHNGPMLACARAVHGPRTCLCRRLTRSANRTGKNEIQSLFGRAAVRMRPVTTPPRCTLMPMGLCLTRGTGWPRNTYCAFRLL